MSKKEQKKYDDHIINKKKKIEFHVHTKASKDSLLNKYFILLMSKLKRIDCIAITDHNEIWYAKKIQPYFAKKGVDIIIGEEIFTKDGEIIGLFLNQRIEENLTAEETINKIKEQNGLVYIPHPFDIKRNETVLKEKTLKKISNKVDFIEMHNGRNVNLEYSKKQNQIAEENKATKIIGSDAHVFYELGRNYCLVNSYEKDVLISEIKKADFVQKKCLNIAHKNTRIVKLIKLIRKGDIDEISRVINKKIRRRK